MALARLVGGHRNDGSSPFGHPDPGTEGPTSLPNPLGVGSLAEVAAILGALSSGSSVLGFGGAAASVWVRYRRGDPVERQQLKWLLAVAALAALFFPASFIIPDATVAGVFFVLGSLTLSALPIAIAIAILRYRLYEIDRIISRTIAYVLITGVLVGAYTAAILLLQGPLGMITGGDTIAVALSTLVAAALSSHSASVSRSLSRLTLLDGPGSGC